MKGEFQSESDHRLQRLFEAYRDACEAPEPGADFMPGIWRKIEARQSVTIFFNRLARGFVASAFAVSLVLGAFVLLPSQQTTGFYSGSYVEALADDQPAGGEVFVEPVHLDQNDSNSDLN